MAKTFRVSQLEQRDEFEPRLKLVEQRIQQVMIATAQLTLLGFFSLLLVVCCLLFAVCCLLSVVGLSDQANSLPVIFIIPLRYF